MEYIKFGLGLFCLGSSVPMLGRHFAAHKWTWTGLITWSGILAIGGVLVKMSV